MYKRQPKAQLRLLFSQPRLGPAAALRQGNTAQDELGSLLEQAVAIETEMLAPDPDPTSLEAALKQQGWTLEWRSWEERLELPINDGLINRWFGPDAPYRERLSNQLSAKEIERLAAALQQRLKGQLPQLLQHQLLVARRLA